MPALKGLITANWMSHTKAMTNKKTMTTAVTYKARVGRG